MAMDKLHAKIVTCKLAIFAQQVQQPAVAPFAHVEHIVVLQEQRRHVPLVALVHIVLTVTQFVLKLAQLIAPIAASALWANIVILQIKLHAKYVHAVDIPIKISKHIANGVLRVSILIIIIMNTIIIISMIAADALMVNIERIKMIALVNLVIVVNIYPQMRIAAMLANRIVKFAHTVDIVILDMVVAAGALAVDL